MSGPVAGVIPIGLGCLSLIPKLDLNAIPDRARRAWWQENVETGLGVLPSVTNLEVRIGEIYAGQNLREAVMPTGFTDDDDSYQNLNITTWGMPSKSSSVKFQITIPKRMHGDLIGGFRGTNAPENFVFETHYGFRGPVTFVRPVDVLGEDKDSSAYIMLVREFLKKELRRTDSAVRVAPTGPSPFHADFGLYPSASAEGVEDHEWVQNEFGYDTVRFFYNPDASTPAQAFELLTNSLVDPFSIYYYLVRAKHERMEAADEIMQKARDLIAMHERRGISSWFPKTFSAGNLARELLLSTLTAKYSDADQRSYLSRETLASNSLAALPALAEKSRHEVEYSLVDQLSLAEDVARTLEGGRITRYEVVVVSASTLLGAAGGAIAALIAG